MMSRALFLPGIRGNMLNEASSHAKFTRASPSCRGAIHVGVLAK